MDKVVIITGAASGIGSATVTRYLKDTSLTVVAIDRNQESLQQLFNDCHSALQSRLLPITLDVSDEVSCQKVFGEIITSYHIEQIVISHGISYDNDISENHKWDSILTVNLMATQRLLSILSEHIIDHGRIVIVSSILGRAGKINNTAYVASKHGLLGLTKALALDLARRKITVNAVLPSWVETPMMLTELNKQANMTGVPLKQMLRSIKKQIPLRKLISAEDVANTILFLASPQASMITAQSIVIDGGYGCGV